jgi:hypothetical protein
MIQFFRNLRLHAISFWAGFIAASLFWWLLRLLRPALKNTWLKLKAAFQSARQGLLTSTDQRHRIDTLKLAQGYHLASPLFSLDEITIPPRFLAPPPLIDPDQPPPYEDSIRAALAYTPDFPEMASFFEMNSLDVFEALGQGANLLITGNPGAGKSFTLAYIASKIARRDPEAGPLQNHVPILLHAANLTIPAEIGDDPLGILITALSAQGSALTQPRLAEMIRTSFASGQAILLLDGLDEITPQEQERYAVYLEHLLTAFPAARYILAVDPGQVGRLPALGLAPLALVAWGPKVQAEFIQRWRDLWIRFIVPSQKETSQPGIDPILLNGWLLNTAPAACPLEFTLKVWALYAGDLRGPGVTDSLESYLRRFTLELPKARPALELLASQLLLNQDFAFSEPQVQEWLSKDSTNPLDTDLVILEESTETETSTQKISVPRILPDLVNTGLIVARHNRRYSLVHPLLVAYLGGAALARQGNSELVHQPAWPLKKVAVPFMAARLDLTPFIQKRLADDDNPLLLEQIDLGRWLQFMPPTLPVRKSILQTLSTHLQEDSLALGLRFRILTTLVNSGDPGVPTLLRHLLNAQYDSVRQLAVLGLGYLRDTQSVGEITRRLRDSLHVAQAACMALVAIGTKPALEATASVILSGDEMLRRAAAEAFASHPKEGHPILVDGSQVEDLLVRRAVIYGLQRVKQPWATEILEHLQIEDAQWVVKDAAALAVSQLMAPDPSTPTPQLPLSQIPWLIAFASERESGLSEGENARQMLLQALQHGTTDQVLAAMGQIRLRGEANIFPAIYHHLLGMDPELAEAAYYTIWNAASMGVPIPSLSQFGLS